MISNMTEEQNFSIFESIVVGIFFYFLIGWTTSPETLPLFDFYPRFFLNILLPVLSSVVMILVFFQKRYLKALISLSVVCLFIVTIYRYSGNYAFRYFALLVLLFSLLFQQRSEKEKRTGSMLIIGLLFLFAAIQKMNIEFLGGAEFVNGSSFMSFYDFWFPGLLPARLSGVFKILPYCSIFTELAIAVGIFIRPRVFAHIAALFVLVLSFINPLVLNVYFLLLPFIILIDDDFYKKLNESSLAHFLRTPFFWAFFIYISISNIQFFVAAVTRNFIFVLILLVIHIKNCEWKTTLKKDYTFNPRVFILPVLMLFLFVSSYLFMPSPFGFKMFSGRRFQVQYYDLKIENFEACHYGQARWFFSPVTDSNWIVTNNECHLLFPTKSGISYASKQLCEKFGGLSFFLKKSTEENGQSLSCSDF